MAYLARTRLASKRAPWTPFALGSSLVAFWDASATSSLTFNGSNIASWRDLANGIVASQVTAANQPGYSATARNGSPGLTYGGTHSLNIAANSFLVTGSAACTICLGHYTTPRNQSSVSWGSFSQNNMRSVGYNTTSHGIDCYNNSFYVPAPCNSDENIIASIGSGTNPTVNLYIDGISRASGTLGTLNTNATSGVIGGWPNSSNIFQGAIQILVITNTSVSASDRQKLEGWESFHDGKNGSNLPAGHPYKSAPPTMSTEDIERLFDEGMYFRDARYRRELGLAPVIRPKLYMPPRRLFLPERLAA